MTDMAGCDLTAAAWYYRQDVVKYFQLARAAMNSEDGSIFLLDMLGGHAGESSIKLRRQNEITGMHMTTSHSV
jgi:mannose/fructose-specific phosphotransferase system component IIA